MKKSILLTLALLMSCSVVKAVDWQEIYIGSDDSVLYIDSDTIQQGKYEDEYLYAVRFVNKGSKEKVAYIKSDFANVRTRWMSMATGLNTTVKYRGAAAELIGINENGALVLRCGTRYVLAYGDEILI